MPNPTLRNARESPNSKQEELHNTQCEKRTNDGSRQHDAENQRKPEPLRRQIPQTSGGEKAKAQAADISARWGAQVKSCIEETRRRDSAAPVLNTTPEVQNTSKGFWRHRKSPPPRLHQHKLRTRVCIYIYIQRERLVCRCDRTKK